MPLDPFSPDELAALRNRRFFELKAAGVERMRAAFDAVRESIRPEAQRARWLCDSEVDVVKGYMVNAEDYLGLPYVVLDFPKHLSRHELFAYRVLFWWSHYVEFTLILQGPWLAAAVERLIERLPAFAEAGVEATLANDPWDNRCGDGFTRPLRDDDATREWLRARECLKLMRWLPCDDPAFTPDRIHAMGVDTWRLYAPLVIQDN